MSKLIYWFVKKLFSIDENKSLDIGLPKKFIVVRQHNQLGDLLAGVSLLRAIKETFPGSTITLITSPSNYHGVIKNKYIDRLFNFDKKRIFDLRYLRAFYNLLREGYDIAIVPVTVSISFTSNLIARISNSKIRIGANSLDGIQNKSAFLFDRRVNIDWRKYPDSNVAERSLDLIRPFGISTNNFQTEISFDKEDTAVAEKFISEINLSRDEFLIGFHVGAGKIPNRWSLKKFIMLMEKLKEKYPVRFYLTGSSADKEEIEFIKTNFKFEMGQFINKKISEVAAVISMSDLFVSNDTGIMHVAGATNTPQVSLFGPTNPFNWAPIGENKKFIRKSELLDDINVDEVYEVCTLLLKNKEKVENAV